MIVRLATLAGIGLFGAFQAGAEDLPARSTHSPAHERYSAVGLASWYGSEFQGHATANGEIFDMRALSAAHRTMPLPSYARVTNLANGRSIVVRVNDRGPVWGGRVLDVSARVASLLEFSHVGLAKVRVDYVGRAPPAGADASMLLASLNTGGSTGAAPAHAPPEEGVTTIARAIADSLGPSPASPAAHRASEDGVTIVAQSATQRPAPEARSPFGELIAYPFLVKASWP